MPVTWNELKRAFNARRPDRLTWEAPDALRRLVHAGDLFAPLLKMKQTLPEQFLALVPAPTGEARTN